MKNNNSLFILCFLMICTFSNITSQNIGQCELSESKEILNAYLKSYFIAMQLNLKTDSIMILDKKSVNLHKQFLGRINDKEARFLIAKKNCDEMSTNKIDTLTAGPCIMKKNLEKFINIITPEEKNYFRRYISLDYSINYKKMMKNQNVKFIDSTVFHNKEIDSRTLHKLEFRGPFFSQDNTKALLEVYKNGEDGFAAFLIFKKQKNEWTMIGNVNW